MQSKVPPENQKPGFELVRLHQERGIAFFGKVAYPAGAMKHPLFGLALIGLGLASCERHEWKSRNGKPGTEELFKHESKEGKKEADKEGEEKHEGEEDTEPRSE